VWGVFHPTCQEPQSYLSSSLVFLVKAQFPLVFGGVSPPHTQTPKKHWGKTPPLSQKGERWCGGGLPAPGWLVGGGGVLRDCLSRERCSHCVPPGGGGRAAGSGGWGWCVMRCKGVIAPLLDIFTAGSWVWKGKTSG